MNQCLSQHCDQNASLHSLFRHGQRPSVNKISRSYQFSTQNMSLEIPRRWFELQEDDAWASNRCHVQHITAIYTLQQGSLLAQEPNLSTWQKGKGSFLQQSNQILTHTRTNAGENSNFRSLLFFLLHRRKHVRPLSPGIHHLVTVFSGFWLQQCCSFISWRRLSVLFRSENSKFCLHFRFE